LTAKFSDPNANQTGDLDSYVEQFLFLMSQTRGVSEDTQILLFTENLSPFLSKISTI
jgi:hypothetical protein